MGEFYQIVKRRNNSNLHRFFQKRKGGNASTSFLRQLNFVYQHFEKDLTENKLQTTLFHEHTCKICFFPVCYVFLGMQAMVITPLDCCKSFHFCPSTILYSIQDRSAKYKPNVLRSLRDSHLTQSPSSKSAQ